MVRITSPVVIVLVIAALLIGCTFTHRLDPTPKTDAWPPTTKIPIHAGVFYSQQFSDQEYTRITGAHIWKVPIGANSVRLFDDMLPRVFEKTSRVSKLYGDELSAKGISVIVAPSLEHFDFRTGMDADSNRYSVSYRTTLYTTRGVPVASWIVYGNAASKTMWTIESLIEDDMNDAAIKYLKEFNQNAGPAITAISKNAEGQTSPLDLRNIQLNAKPAELPGLDAKQVAALQEGGLMSLQVTVQSESEGGFVIRASDMRLRLIEGQVIEPSTLSSVLNILDQTSQMGAAVAAAVGAPLGVLSDFIQQRSKQSEREAQIRSGGLSLFGDRTLSKGKKETGLVLFRLPKAIKSVGGVTLTAWVVDPATAEGKQIIMPLSIAP
jgi:hypothetical protein